MRCSAGARRGTRSVRPRPTRATISASTGTGRTKHLGEEVARLEALDALRVRGVRAGPVVGDPPVHRAVPVRACGPRRARQQRGELALEGFVDVLADLEARRALAAQRL